MINAHWRSGAKADRRRPACGEGKRPIGVLLQAKPEVEQPGPDDLCLVGTVASILRYITTPDGTHHAICQGQQRFRVVEYLDGYPFLVAPRVGRIEEPEAAGNEIEARFVQLKERGRFKSGSPASSPPGKVKLGELLEGLDVRRSTAT